MTPSEAQAEATHYHLTMYYWIEGAGDKWTVHLIDSQGNETAQYETAEHIETIRTKHGHAWEVTRNDVQDKDAWFLNHYRCPDCKEEWEDEWDCMCNDRCPVCNAEIEPYSSEEL